MSTTSKRMTVNLAATSTERLEAVKQEIEAELQRRQAKRDEFDLTWVLWGDLPAATRQRPRRQALCRACKGRGVDPRCQGHVVASDWIYCPCEVCEQGGTPAVDATVFERPAA